MISKLIQHTANIPVETTLLLQHFAIQGISTTASPISPSPMVGKSLKYCPLIIKLCPEERHLCYILHI